MNRAGRLGLAALLAGVGAIAGAETSGCRDRSGRAPAPAEATDTTRAVVLADAAAQGPTGSVRGTVTLGVPAPAMERIEARCHDAAEPIEEEHVVTDDQGRLKNVVVYLDVELANAGEAPAARVPVPAPQFPPAVLDQVNCRYVPHVLAIRVGQPLRVKNSDPTLHNVHTFSLSQTNFGMPRPGEAKDLTFPEPEIFAVKCDVHPWMLAHVAVFDHPYFAVTGDGGSFEIKGVPPGGYDLVAWHERYGETRKTVTVTPDGQTVADFRYGPDAGE